MDPISGSTRSGVPDLNSRRLVVHCWVSRGHRVVRAMISPESGFGPGPDNFITI
jgi:hypothetical protein